MGIRYTLLALALVCLMVSGCAKKHPQPEPEANPMVIKFEKFRQTYDSSTYKAENSEFDLSSGADDDNVEYAPASISGPNSGVTSIVLARAHRSIGTPYVFGGTQPGGFDCSGLVQWAYKGAGIRLPRTAREQSQAGFGIRNRSQMRAGDIVAFRRRSGGGYHTGIYIGDGKFIHAPRRNKRVRIESMETGYFARNFIGARRVDTSNRSTELALATEKADRQYTARKSKSSKSKVARTGVSKKSSKATASRKAQASRNKVQASRTKAKAQTGKNKATKNGKAQASKKSKSKKTAAASQKTASRKAGVSGRSGQSGASAKKAQAAGKSQASKSRDTKQAAKKQAASSGTKQARAKTAKKAAKDNRKIEVRVARKNGQKAKSSASNATRSKDSKG